MAEAEERLRMLVRREADLVAGVLPLLLNEDHVRSAAGLSRISDGLHENNAAIADLLVRMRPPVVTPDPTTKTPRRKKRATPRG